MHYKLATRLMQAACLALLALASPQAGAHVLWSQTNKNDMDLIALYHFDDEVTTAGQIIRIIKDLPIARSLTVNAPAAAGMHTIIETNAETSNGNIFAPYALQLESAQLAQSTETLQTGLTGDLTIECWFRWDAALTSQSARIGLSSAAKLEIARDTLNPANDRFGLRLTHNDFASAPGFTNWGAIGDEEAPLGDWLHAAITIQSQGIVYAPALGHDIYTTGTVARFWLNGHPFGVSPYTAELGNLRLHDTSTIRIQSLSGALGLDEITIWKRDWSEHGSSSFPFSDGRGSGLVNAARRWRLYE